ncbi:two-component system, NarL family, nitrate/nitrite response regulator NarL [Pustulibacterium marinum]|uniref:Two-component system, NarL family, nitrate/nitrite response regulator NarL n=1 Tax=Pustulibacterium marinum TaxID=1224947 RepID=A0A1I7EVM6_9FLAO|nr:response regulator transcription factor [Pustulibacterium marinum]SFU27945.1 two-component system, NarL family, nitrate/nitrite response regulator NarL [Pustulibacterium marinum]
MIRVILAEDHQALIDGIKLSLEFEDNVNVIGEANDGEALVSLVDKLRPEVVITDIRMPKCDGIAATERIKEKHPHIKVIAFSMFDQPEAVEQMKKAGASGYVRKNSSLKILLKAIYAVAEGKSFFDNKIIVGNDEVINEEIILSRREEQILKFVGEGFTSNEIAEKLSIGKSTVDTHRKNILRKINAYGKTDLMRYAIERKYDF